MRGIYIGMPKLARKRASTAKITESAATTLSDLIKRNTAHSGTSSRGRKMNRNEERFYAILKNVHKDALIIPQPTRFFRFENGDSYTPDFIVIESNADQKFSSVITSYECKGGYKGPGAEQGYERYHRAKEQFSKYGIGFIMAIWDNINKRYTYK